MFSKCIHWSLGKIRQFERFGSFQVQHKRAHDHQRAFRITTSAAIARHIRLIVKTRLFRDTRAWHITLNMTLKPRHHTTVSVCRSVLSVCVQRITISECIVLGDMSKTWTLLMDQTQKAMRQSKIPDFFAAK